MDTLILNLQIAALKDPEFAWQRQQVIARLQASTPDPRPLINR